MIQTVNEGDSSPLVVDAQVDVVSIAADIATIAGVLFAVVAAWIAVGSLRSQARGQKLESIAFTNAIWDAVNKLGSTPLQIAPSTVEIIRRIYSDLEREDTALDNTSALGNSTVSEPLSMQVPFIIGALLPRGNLDKASAPTTGFHYLDQQQARTVALGYVWTMICDESAPPPWAQGADLTTARRELAAIDRAMEAWVERVNEVAELFELAVLDQRAFVGIRSVALVQRLFVAEPYILWRNTVMPGRWGLRLFALGSAARSYHWASALQRDSLRLWVNPEGFYRSADYLGFAESLGWIIGPGSTRTGPFAQFLSWARIKIGLRAPFSERAKQGYNKIVAGLPHNPGSGYAVSDSTLSWRDVVTDPSVAARSIKKLHATMVPKRRHWSRVEKTP